MTNLTIEGKKHGLVDTTDKTKYKAKWQKFCGKCGHIYPKTYKSNVCPECGAMNAQSERKIITV